MARSTTVVMMKEQWKVLGLLRSCICIFLYSYFSIIRLCKTARSGRMSVFRALILPSFDLVMTLLMSKVMSNRITACFDGKHQAVVRPPCVMI